jgi:hypothetical protein
MEIATFYVFLALVLLAVLTLKEQHAKQTGGWISAQVDIRESHSLPVRVILAIVLCSLVTIVYLIALSDISLSWLAWNTNAALTTALTIFLTLDETDQQNQIFNDNP